MNIRRFQLGMLGTNCYLAWPEDSDEAIIVDPADCTTHLLDEIAKNKLNIKYLILTHGHYDHISGIEQLMEKFPEAKLVAGKDEIDVLSNPNLNHSTMMFGRPIELTPNILVSDNDIIKLGDIELKIIATPGHSKGGISIYVENLLFSGDTLFQMSIGRTDLEGGDFPTLEKSIKEKLYVLPDETVVLPGHTDVTSIEFEKKYNPFVKG